MSRADAAAVGVTIEEECPRDSRVWNQAHLAESRSSGCEDDTVMSKVPKRRLPELHRRAEEARIVAHDRCSHALSDSC